MPLKRNTKQSSETLIKFYSELANSEDELNAKSGKLMIEWLDRINEHFKTTEIWGLTSHRRLNLQNADIYPSTSYVRLTAEQDFTTGADTYYIEYLIPKSEQPWEHATVKGSTNSIDKAMEMLKAAMRNSNGWPRASELDH